VAELSIAAHDRSYTIDVDPDSLIGGRIVESGQPYEAPLLEHIFERGFRGIAVDAGAHIGNHSLWLAAICELEVWAFEPLVFEELAANIARNALDGRVQARLIALGDRCETAHVVGKGKLRPGHGDIPVRPLDEFDIDDVAVIKIDVEDMEPYVLRGAAETIQRSRPVIFAEARDDECHQAIAEVLDPWGYVMTQRFGVRWTPVECWEPQ
jgi:FkbM family methyltransferase